MGQKILRGALKPLMIQNVPKYANKFFYSLGFLSMISFVTLLITGLIMAAYGPTWWLTNSVGIYVRSVHLWATQAFVLFIILHLCVVFFTSGFRGPRRLTWVFGSLMFLFALAEAEFGYVLRGDFSSQWRSLQGADFYNGSHVGNLLNSLNYKQIYGIHLVVVPMIILGLLFLHYLLVKTLGIAKPYRKDVAAATVPANHNLLFLRGATLVVLILALAAAYPSPFLKPTTIKEIADTDPFVMSKTLVAEFDNSSDTATYLDTMNPYTYSVRKVYVDDPYALLLKVNPSAVNYLAEFNALPEAKQQEQLKAASDYYAQDSAKGNPPKNLVIAIVGSLSVMAKTGLYESSIAASSAAARSQDDTTYVARFLSDTGVLEAEAEALNMTTPQYGMLHEETGNNPVGAWWLAPIGVLNHTVLAHDDNGDRDGAVILGLGFMLLIAFPYIPYVNQLPDKLKVYKIIWR